MVELLVALLILSVGVLGMASLQGASMRQATSALLQNEAVLLGQDLLERIRANPTVDYGNLRFAADPRGVTDCTGRQCSPEQMRDYDLAQWQCSLNSTTPGGDQHAACVAFGIRGALPGGDCTDETSPCAGGALALAGGIYQVTIKWAGPGGETTLALGMSRPAQRGGR